MEPEKVTEKIFRSWVVQDTHDKNYPYWWNGLVFPDKPACVPQEILGLKENIVHIYHAMKVNCSCAANSNASVVCLAEFADGTYVKDIHKPGRCPHLIYAVNYVNNEPAKP